MKSLILFISLQIISLVYSKTIYISDEIWQNVKIYARNGLMLYNKNYFIYDEKNYTKLDIHGEKMLALNQKQYETYIKNDNLSNYIFIVEHVDEYKLQDIADELSLKIKRDIDYDHNYILTLFSISNHKVQFYSGKTAHNIITSDNHEQILNHIKRYLRIKDYYKAWSSLIEDYNYYYHYKSFFDRYSNLIAIIIIFVFFIIKFLVGNNGISLCCSCSGGNRYSYRDRNSVASGGFGGSW